MLARYTNQAGTSPMGDDRPIPNGHDDTGSPVGNLGRQMSRPGLIRDPEHAGGVQHATTPVSVVGASQHVDAYIVAATYRTGEPSGSVWSVTPTRVTGWGDDWLAVTALGLRRGNCAVSANPICPRLIPPHREIIVSDNRGDRPV